MPQPAADVEKTLCSTSPETPAFGRQGRRLEGAGEDRPDQRLQAGLDGLPHADLGTDTMDRSADRFHERLGALQSRIGARGHHGQCPTFRAGPPAADRAVDKMDASAFEPRTDIAHFGRFDCCCDDDNCTLAQDRCQTVLPIRAEEHIIRLTAIHHHDEGRIAPLRGLLRRAGAPTVHRREVLHALGFRVEARHIESGCNEILRQPRPHVAEADHAHL